MLHKVTILPEVTSLYWVVRNAENNSLLYSAEMQQDKGLRDVHQQRPSNILAN